MPRVRSQLAIQAPPELLARIKAAAATQRRTVTSLLLDWIEAGLASSGRKSKGAVGTDLADRVSQLEAQVAALCPQSGGPPSPERVSLEPQSGDAISTAQLAEQTKTNRASWNNWAAKAKPGDVRQHPDAGSWRLMGKVPAATGGPDRWLWEPA
jgi:hypothetical protein